MNAEDAAHAAQHASTMGKEFTFLARQLKSLVNQILLDEQNNKQPTAQDAAGHENNNDVTVF